jgi:hypothetical protein
MVHLSNQKLLVIDRRFHRLQCPPELDGPRDRVAEASQKIDVIWRKRARFGMVDFENSEVTGVRAQRYI